MEITINLPERVFLNLSKVAKMHFRTALRAQGLPEPPKVEWRGRSN